MKDKRAGTRITVFFLIGMLLLGLCGCSLAVEEGDGAQTQDQLIGALVTRDYVEKTYADIKWVDHGISSLNFNDIEGYYFLYTIREGETGGPVYASEVSEGIDCKLYLASNNKEETSVELNASISILPGADRIVYLNPVYMTADHQVYAAPGNSVKFGEKMNAGDGSIGSTISSEEKRNTKNSETKESVKITADFELAYEPVKVRFSEKDANHNLLKRMEFTPGEVPDQYTPQEQTAYILVETEKIDEAGAIFSTREICSWDGSETMTDQTGDQPLEKKCTVLRTPYSEEKGFVLNEITWIMWP